MKTKIGWILGILAAVAVYWKGSTVLLGAGRNYVRGLAKLEPKTVKLGGESVAYLEGGPGEPLVLLHDLGGNKDAWDGFAKVMSASNHLYALDLPGFGESTRTEGADYGFDAQVTRLEGVVSALHLEKFHLLGHSMGAGVAGLYAGKHPERVLTLGLFAPAGIQGKEKSEYQKALGAKTDPLAVHGYGDFEHAMDFLFDIQPEMPTVIRHGLAVESAANVDFNKKVGAQLLKTPPGFLEPILPTLHMPLYALWCDHDRVLHPSGLDVIRTLAPAAKTTLMKMCGHIPHSERPEDAGRAYHDFLQDLKL